MAEITCKRCGRTAEPPEDTTWGGEIGEAIQNQICKECWAEWEDLSVKIVNEYRLSMANREHYAMFVQQLKIFLGLESDPSGPASPPPGTPPGS